MTFSFLIVQLAHARELKLFCIGGFLLGLATFFSALHSRRPQIPNEPPPSPTPSSHASRRNSAQLSAPEIIQLSSEPAPTRSADMTQQQKIAAALSRAGISHAAWINESSNVAVEALDPADSGTSALAAPQNQTSDFDSLQLNSSLRNTTFIWCGLTLSLISLVAFLIIH